MLNDAGRHVYITQTVVTLLFFVYLRLNDTHFIFYGKTFDSQAPIKLKTLRSLRVRFLLSEVSSTINEVKAGYKANGPSPREAQ